ncbi:MAG: hypothetical protein U1E59_08710 [Amaricoccus sp.]
MYLPENNDQMFDILTDLRTYAAQNGLAQLAEKLDDALLLLVTEGSVRARGAQTGAGTAKQDKL